MASYSELKKLSPKQFAAAFAFGATIAILAYLPQAYSDFGFIGVFVLLLAMGSFITSTAYYLGLLARIKKMVAGEQKRN